MKILNKIKQTWTKATDNKFCRVMLMILIPLLLFVPYFLAQMALLVPNIIVNLIAIGLAIWVLIYDLKHPTVKSNMSWKKKILAIIVCLVVVYLLNALIATLISSNSQIGTSANQKALITTYKGKIWALIATTCFLAPIFEETIYRRDIIRFNNKKSFWISYLASIILFALSHMAYTPLSEYNVILLYLIPAICLTSVYAYTRDIRCSMIAHSLYNLSAALLLLL